MGHPLFFHGKDSMMNGFKIKDQALWELGLANNTEPYGRAVYEFAASWAALMESKIDAGSKLEDIAKQTSHEASADSGITGFQYGCAVNILSTVWEYGERLRVWHNLDCQIGTEGEEANRKGTILNPALLQIS